MDNKRFVAPIISAWILIVLVLAGGVSAFNVNLTPENNRDTSGKVVNFHLTIDGNSENLDSLKLELSGPENFSCEFDSEGNPIGSCKKATLKLLKESYGYGYGSNKDLKYKITLDASSLKSGTYNVKLDAFAGSESSSDSATITIKDKGR